MFIFTWNFQSKSTKADMSSSHNSWLLPNLLDSTLQKMAKRILFVGLSMKALERSNSEDWCDTAFAISPGDPQSTQVLKGLVATKALNPRKWILHGTRYLQSLIKTSGKGNLNIYKVYQSVICQ